MSARLSRTTPNRPVGATRRVAVIGKRNLSLPVCDALRSLGLPIAVDLFVDGLDGSISLRGSNIRCISGFDNGNRVDRFDLSARYDAVLYTFDLRDAPRLVRMFPRSAGRTAVDWTSLSFCPNEFTFDEGRPGRARGGLVSAATVASRVGSFLRDMNDSSRAWSNADPALWIETQYPAAVIENGRCAAVAEELGSAQTTPVDGISTAA